MFASPRTSAKRPIESALLLHIGDYVDRGADTAGVIARLVDGCPIPGMDMVNLMGNHESTMLDALSGERAAGTDWLFAGGKAALESYGIDPEGPRDQWAALIPQSHQDFLRNLVLMHREGGYAFIHAGVRPGIALEDQARDDLLRSRQPFLYSEADFGAVVVHGHTPVKVRGGPPQPHRHRHRGGVRRQADLRRAGGRHAGLPDRRSGGSAGVHCSSVTPTGAGAWSRDRFPLRALPAS